MGAEAGVQFVGSARDAELESVKIVDRGEARLTGRIGGGGEGRHGGGRNGGEETETGAEEQTDASGAGKQTMTDLPPILNLPNVKSG